MLPRWLPSAVGESSGLALVTSPEALSTEATTKIRQWRSGQSLTTAAELVSAAFVEGPIEEAVEAARYIVGNRESAPPEVLRLASRIAMADDSLGGAAITSLGDHRRVRATRHLVRTYPHAAPLWLDLAREYSLIGQNQIAARHVDTALRLAPQHRRILRSASRFFHHIGDTERAHHTVSRVAQRSGDPWLLAAETAFAMVLGKVPTALRNTMRIADSGRWSPMDLSELRASLGTLELLVGTTRRARKWYRASLDGATENALAQVSWSLPNVPGLELAQEQVWGGAHEAKVHIAERAQDWTGVVGESDRWLEQEPYSQRPAELGSYIASVALGDSTTAAIIARKGLLASPTSQGLLNNLAFALARSGDPTEGRRILEKIEADKVAGSLRVAVLATHGAVAYAMGDPILGEKGYSEAVESATSQNLSRSVGLALAHWAQAELESPNIHLRLDHIGNLLARAESILRGLPGREVDDMLERLRVRFAIARAR
jgi:tetratricopeptide (TPR) repeat protein